MRAMLSGLQREYRSGSDPRTLRRALGAFATGVTIVTCQCEDGLPFGLTVNSFTAVSLEPPLVLFCVGHWARGRTILGAARHFGVNVLQSDQQPASMRFATPGEDRFGTTPWFAGETGTPLLQDSLAVFECERHAVHGAGDHDIIIGRVIRANFDLNRNPLIYFRGQYRRPEF